MTTIPERIAAARATGSKAIAVEIEQVERWMAIEADSRTRLCELLRVFEQESSLAAAEARIKELEAELAAINDQLTESNNQLAETNQKLEKALEIATRLFPEGSK